MAEKWPEMVVKWAFVIVIRFDSEYILWKNENATSKMISTHCGISGLTICRQTFDAKGQLISKCPLGVIVWTKIPTKKLPRFLPKPLRRGQIKNFIKPIMLNNP